MAFSNKEDYREKMQNNYYGTLSTRALLVFSELGKYVAVYGSVVGYMKDNDSLTYLSLGILSSMTIVNVAIKNMFDAERFAMLEERLRQKI